MKEFVKNVNSGLLNLDEFLRGLILCHGTRTKIRPSSKQPPIAFDYISHEDDCILSFARQCGYSFESSLVYSHRNCYKVKIHNIIEYYPIISMNYTTKNRQRFSVLFERNLKFNHIGGFGGILYVRGSFKHMQNCLKLRNVEKDHLRNICWNLENMGYQIMVYGRKELKQNEMEECIKRFELAKTNLTIDDEELEDLYNRLEQNVVFLTLICLQEKLKPEIRPFVDRCYEAGIKIGVFSGDSLSSTLSVVFKAKIFDFSKEIMVLEGDNAEKIMNGVQALLDHIHQTIRKDLKALEEESTPLSPQKIKQFCYEKPFKFNYFLVFHSSSLKIIYHNPYLLRHILFLCYFADGILGYELSPKDKARLLKILQQSSKEIEILSLGNSHLDDKMMDLGQCSIEELTENAINTHNGGDLLIKDLSRLEKLIFKNSKRYIMMIWLLLGHLVYMNFLLVWPRVLFVIYYGFYPGELFHVWLYEHFCMVVMGVVYFFEAKAKEKQENFFLESKNLQMFNGLIKNNVFMALIDGGLLFLYLVFNQNLDNYLNFEVFFMVFVIMTLKLYLNMEINKIGFILLTFCNFGVLIIFVFISKCISKALFLQEKMEVIFFIMLFGEFLSKNIGLLILISSFVIITHFINNGYLIKDLMLEESKKKAGIEVNGREILKVLREIFYQKESELLIKEIEESI